MEHHPFYEINALPVNVNDPVLIGVFVTATGVFVNIVIVDRDILVPSNHFA